MADSSRNSRPNIADELEFTDGVAFITGAATISEDEDYFSFSLVSDATVQAELAHFDLQTSDLDLEILDDNLGSGCVVEQSRRIREGRSSVAGWSYLLHRYATNLNTWACVVQSQH